eukprot:Platyproteum_vivax@DN2442_c0_g1_i1.p1
MGRKKAGRSAAKLKPFCYYCDREFDDEKVLVQHQKAKHFKCLQCNRKLDTATGLVVHMLQVHKESCSKVPNAMSGREDPELVVHGMEGIPNDVISAKKAEKGVLDHGLSSAHQMALMPGGLMPFAPMGGMAARPLMPQMVNPAFRPPGPGFMMPGMNAQFLGGEMAKANASSRLLFSYMDISAEELRALLPQYNYDGAGIIRDQMSNPVLAV